jgi:hypothetical protein
VYHSLFVGSEQSLGDLQRDRQAFPEFQRLMCNVMISWITAIFG